MTDPHHTEDHGPGLKAYLWIFGGLAILTLITFLAYLLLTRTESTSPRAAAPKPLLDQADAGMEQFTFTQTKDGVVQWEVKAKQASLFEEQNHALLKTVEVTLFGVRGSMRALARMRMTAEVGINEPYRVIRWENGSVSLSDTKSGQRIYLNAFGPDQVAAFEKFLGNEGRKPE